MHETSSNLSYELDKTTRDLLVESAPLMWTWSRECCVSKNQGGMEEWALKNEVPDSDSCGWYHGTWQFLRLLNMVAVPPWYSFYMPTLGRIFRAKPKANVFISAAADWGMLAMVHEAAEAVGATPTITLWDICETPLRASHWYADRFGFKIETRCDNILTSPDIALGTYDLVVTDEFLTVLDDQYKQGVTERWFDLLKPGGVVVTTAMIGAPTSSGLRDSYALRARTLMDVNPHLFEKSDASREEMIARFDIFASRHTRHMLRSFEQMQELFTGYSLTANMIVTPGECINPTTSCQIVAHRPA